MYRETLLFDLEVALNFFILPTHYIQSGFVDKISNPFTAPAGKMRYLPPPCLNARSFCVEYYATMFHSTIGSGVYKVLMYLLSDANRISGDITFDPVLLNNIKRYKGRNKLIFRVKR